MRKEDLEKYLETRVLLIHKNGYRYKFLLTKKCIKDTSLSFIDKFNNPVDINIEDISIITISNDQEEGK